MTEMISEHEAVEKKTDGSNEQASPEEVKAKKLVMKLLDRAKKHRSKFDGNWLDDYKMFRGKQWKRERPSYRHSAVINVVFQAIQSQVPILTDSRPKIEFLPQEPNDRELSEILNDLIEHDWDKGNWLREIVDLLYDSHFFGGAVPSLEWDDEDGKGPGKIILSAEDTLQVFPDPLMVNINDDKGRYFIVVDLVEKDELKRRYPHKKQEIKADVLELAKGDKFDLSKERATPPVDKDSDFDYTDSPPEDQDAKLALEITCHLKDDTQEDFEEEFEATRETDDGIIERYTEKREGSKKKYPLGRKIIIAGGAVVFDGPNVYEDGKFPYAKVVNYPDPHQFWGISEIEQMREPQRMYNKIYSFILDTMNLMGNPQWVIDTSSGIDTSFLLNRPGEVILKNPGSEARRESGVGLPPFIQNIMQTVRTELDNISGSQDVSRGAKPAGGLPSSGIAIESLQEAAQTRLRQKSRNIDALLQDLGQMYLSRVFQFYTVPRVFRLTNSDGSQKFFKFHTETGPDEDGNEMRVAKIREFVQQDDGSAAVGDERVLQIQGNMDVKVSTGSSLAFLKDRKRREVLELLQLGVVDAQYAVEQLDVPGGEAVLERQAEAAAAQQAAEGAAQGGAPPA